MPIMTKINYYSTDDSKNWYVNTYMYMSISDSFSKIKTGSFGPGFHEDLAG